MAVVVTGAAGFVGRHLVARLRQSGHEVVGIDRRPGAGAATAHLRADLADGDDAVTALLRDADAVFHLAGQPGVRGGGAAVARARWRDNVIAGWRVLTATPPAVPVVVASSSSVYGGARRVGGLLRASRETDDLRPRGGYARSKRMLERLCARRAATGGHVAVVRPFTVVGEGQRPDMALARWIAAARAGRPLVIHGAADRARDLTDVGDVVEVLVRCWERDVRTTVNAGTGRPVTLAAMTAAVADVLGVPVDAAVRPAHRDEVAQTCADTRRCEALLSLTPATDLHAVVGRQAGVAPPSRAAASTQPAASGRSLASAQPALSDRSVPPGVALPGAGGAARDVALLGGTCEGSVTSRDAGALEVSA